MWCNGLDLEEWEDSCSKEESYYLHGNCDTWVLENYQAGDIPVIWNEFDEDIGKVCIIHCYILRNGYYVDVRGKTDNIEDVIEGFDYGYDNAAFYCKDLEEYKKTIRQICHYRSKKWA